MNDVTAPLAPIQQEALELLEWPRLAEQLASFASTTPGRCACLELALPACLAASRSRRAAARVIAKDSNSSPGAVPPLAQRVTSAAISATP